MIAARQVDYFTDVDKALLRAILYFDIFDYPITTEEAIAFSPFSINSFFYEQSIEKLVREKLIFRFGNFYSIQNNPLLLERRINGNALAQRRMKTARRYSKLISSFPFVRAVLLSGSISKGFMEKQSDIDYFIITEAKRLWIVRTALAIFRRVFLLNSHRNLCTNYFIDTDNLFIPDQNIFTATELSTLKPMYGQETIEKLLGANRWVFLILPQAKFDLTSISNEKSPFKNFIEQVFSFRGIDQLNRWLMKKSMMFWKRKYSRTVESGDFEIAFRTREGISKSHPRFFQKKALEQFEINIQNFESKHGLDLSL